MLYSVDQEEILFRKILRYSLGFYFLLGVAITVVHLPDLKKPDIHQLSDRVAKLILEPPKISVPPPVKLESPQAKAPVKPEIKEKKEAKEKVSPENKPKLIKKPEVKKEVPQPSLEDNREMVRKTGLLASFIEEESEGRFSELIEDDRLEKVFSSAEVVSAKPAKKKKKSSLSAVGRPGRSELANKKIASLSKHRQSEAVRLEKREEVTVTEIAAAQGGVDGKGHGLGQDVGLRVKGRNSERTPIDYDAIARVVDKYKGGLVYLYNKELRSKPTLKGTVTVEFSIDGEGKVIDARVVNSTMDHQPLEQALAKRIRMWKFPKLYPGIIVLTYPFVFFPV